MDFARLLSSKVIRSQTTANHVQHAAMVYRNSSTSYPNFLWTYLAARHFTVPTTREPTCTSNSASRETIHHDVPASKESLHKIEANKTVTSTPDTFARSPSKFRLPRRDRTNFEVIAAATTETPAPKFQPGPLPSLPDKPTEYPTPHITQHDFSTYITPLYSNRWFVTWERRPAVKKGSYKSPQLSRRYLFRGFSPAIAFIQDVATICKDENHHPVLTVDGSRVDIRTSTHSGIRPLGSETETIDDRIAPGLTLRDVRLAVLVEQLFKDVYITDGRGRKETGDVLPRYQQPRSITTIFRESKHVLKEKRERTKKRTEVP